MDHGDELYWEQEYAELMEIAREHLLPQQKYGETVVLKTKTGNIYITQIPDYQNCKERELLENRCIQRLIDAEDTEVTACLATMNGKEPEILSWNFRSRLIELDERNLKTECFLWGGEDTVYLKPFSSLLPPGHTIRKST